ncbi:MAG TPA: hypothetical protein VHB30_05555, partial [Solirubrobacteraceae bacterium]|nr:hypothetical protein [Solirubrobacteraceae bacterium]
GADAALYLPFDGDPQRAAERVMAAAARLGTDLDGVAEVVLVPHPVSSTADARLHEAADAYVPLHAGCAGHERLARAVGAAVIAPGALARWLATEVPAAAADHPRA